MAKDIAKSTAQSNMHVLEPIIDKYVFAKPLQGDEAKAVYEEVQGRIKKDFKNAPEFNGYFKFNEQTREINGSDLYHGILINKVLNQEGLWLPTFIQGKKLDDLGKLSNQVYRDFGVAGYSNNNPNKDIAERLIKGAEKRGWELPILASFNALKLIKTGVKISFDKNTQGIITGDEAKQYLDKNFDYKANAGVRRLGRGSVGGWVAAWYRLGGSLDPGRVDFVCGEATTKNLERAVLTDINKIAEKEVKAMNTRIASAREIALKTLRG